VGLACRAAVRNLLFVKRIQVNEMMNPTIEKVNQARKAAAQMVARWRREQNGSSLIEFALVMPPMLLLMTGIFSLSLVLYHQQELTQAVGAGAQYLQQIRTTTTDPCKDTFTAITSAAPTLTSGSITLTVTMGSTAVTAKTCSGDQTDLTQGGSITVTATYPCAITGYNYTFGSACTLSSKVTEYEY
jgi:Flp pilus assembly protein TadG